jgi:hypothetical protein
VLLFPLHSDGVPETGFALQREERRQREGNEEKNKRADGERERETTRETNCGIGEGEIWRVREELAQQKVRKLKLHGEVTRSSALRNKSRGWG